jgi:CubicO group peptidase (beta-lactamase class C family)
MKKLLSVFMAIVLLAMVYGGFYLSPVLSAGSGFAAKNLCSAHFLSGLPGQQIIDEALTPASSVLAKTRFNIDEDKRLVDAGIYGLFERRAVFSEGTGCTLLQAGKIALPPRVKTPVSKPDNDHLDWPEGAAGIEPDRRLQTVIDAAFAEPGGEFKRNTKAVVVIHKGQLVAEKYAPGIDSATPLIGWSMTKSVTNLLTGLLVHDGRLALDQPAPVAAWHSKTGDPRAEITIDQLLRMSSGLEFEEEYALFSDVTRMLAVEPDAGGFAASKPLLAEPDSLWYYSSGTSNILSGIIRRTVGGEDRQYYDFAQQRLFNPLGIYTASIETDYNGTYVGSSFMYASARDWARLGQLCLQNGRWQGQQLLPADWIQYSTSPTPTNPRNNYGAHFWLNADPADTQQERTWPSLPADTYSMNGFQGQRVVIVPSKDLVVVRLGFSGGKKRGIEQLVAGVIDILAPE